MGPVVPLWAALLCCLGSFAGVVSDIHAWWPKVKVGGVFAGHDFVDGEFPEGDYKGKIGQPTKGKQGPNRAPNRALIGTLKKVIFFNDVYSSVIKMGREYSHWIDLRLIKPMEVVI